MKPVSTSRVRTVLLAAIAALCLVAFGAVPHSSPASASAASGSVAPTPQAQVADHHNAEIVARTQSPSGVGEWSALPSADLGPAGPALTIAGLLLALLLLGRRTAVRYRIAPAPARAPPLAA